ncbi:MAG: hypothetical protein KF832_02625 [Caldilineaceae bacterium]|nr:hypothetical protein [Caldilineaceae bacterium]
MKRILLLTSLLLVGLILSQLLPILFGALPEPLNHLRQFLTMALLAYIMIEVGREFEIDFSRKSQYAKDYLVAATAAAFPWIFCTIYFLAFLMPEINASGKAPWMEAMLAARFAAPTSAGVLFSMLAAAGLAGTWAFRKTRILAIFDDLDTVLFMLPLKALMVGLAWQLGVVVVITTCLLIFGYRYFRKVTLPASWPWILGYAFLLAAISELLYTYSKDPVTLVAVHIEVLLPAFLLGCILKQHHHEEIVIPGEDPAGMTAEERVGLIVSCLFLLLVGLSMPAAIGENAAISIDMSIGEVIFHVLAITLLANLGKMFVVFFYRDESTLRERFAVAIAMFPRGEVGAGVLAVSLSYGIQGPFVTIGFLSLALNLVLTGIFIFWVKRLLTSNSGTILGHEG